MTIKDRAQKQQALRYVVSRGWFPQLEVDVTSQLTIGAAPLAITDADVLAAVPDDFIGFRLFLADCKTQKSASPIGRAIWLRGLMERLRSERGLCIVKRPAIEPDHRYTAAQMGIALIAEGEFDRYANATSRHYGHDLGAIAAVDAWERFYGIGKDFPALAPVIAFAKSAFWMAFGEADCCARTLNVLREFRDELDPERNEHLAVVCDLAALFLLALSVVVNNLFSGYLHPQVKEELSDALRVLLFGGREAYERRLRVKQIVAELLRGDVKGLDGLVLPEWERLVGFVRQALDAPLEMNRSPMIVRELGFAKLGGRDSSFAKTLARASPQGARFALLGVEYTCRAAQLPPEFLEYLQHELLSIQASG